MRRSVAVAVLFLAVAMAIGGQAAEQETSRPVRSRSLKQWR